MKNEHKLIVVSALLVVMITGAAGIAGCSQQASASGTTGASVSDSAVVSGSSVSDSAVVSGSTGSDLTTAVTSGSGSALGSAIDASTYWQVRSTAEVDDDGCLTCHGVEGFDQIPDSHAGYTGDMCTSCHEYVEYGYGKSDNGAPYIPHDVADEELIQ